MILDCNLYTETLDDMSIMINRHIRMKSKPKEIASALCAATSVPIAVCVAYVMQDKLFGPLPELQASLDRLKDFYNYEEIVPFDSPSQP